MEYLIKDIFFSWFFVMRENLTISQLKLIASTVSDPDDLKFFGSTVGPSDFSSWRLGFSIKSNEGFLLHSHGKKLREFKTLDSMSKFVHDNFNSHHFIISFR